MTRFTIAFAAAAAIAFAVVATLAIYTIHIVASAPELEEYSPTPDGPIVLDARGEEIGRLAEEERFHVPIDDISEEVQHAVIATEDRRFYDHRGVDLRAVVRAVVRNIAAGAIVEGASTISQQLARTLYLDQEPTLSRKIAEMYLAVELERRYDKEEILEMYLNEAYFGAGAQGIGAASRRYFDAEADELSPDEAAVLAGVLSAPVHRNPFTNPEAARAQRDIAIANMHDAGFLSAAEAERAAREDTDFVDPEILDEPGQAFLSHIREQLVDQFGAETLYGSEFEIHTTLDLKKQEEAEKAIEESFENDVLPTVVSDDEPIDDKQPQPALVSIDSTDGAVRAMVGGRGNDAYNRAVVTERQPGSALKPFVYSAALEARDFHPGTVVNDMPIYSRGTGESNGTILEGLDDEGAAGNPADDATVVVWPRNFDNRYHGLVSFRRALARSLNVPAVRVADEVGIESVYEHTEAFGFTTFGEEDGLADHYSFPLGGLQHGVTPLQMASAYGTFANQGVHTEPYSIERIVNEDGDTVFEAEPDATRVISPEHAYVMRDMLRSAVEDGTGARAMLPDTPVAGKTGTTDFNTDGWFIGFADEIVTSIWVGEDRALPMYYDYDEDEGEYERGEDGGDVEVLGVHASEVWNTYRTRTEEALAARREFEAELETVISSRLYLRTDTHSLRRLREATELQEFFETVERFSWEYRPEGVYEIAVEPLTGVESRLLPHVDTDEAIEEIALAESGFDILTPTPAPAAAQALEPLLDPAAELRDAELSIDYRYGPAEIRLGGEDGVETAAGLAFEGVYIVDEGEPVQMLDPSLNLPLDPYRVRFEPRIEPTMRPFLQLFPLPLLSPNEDEQHEQDFENMDIESTSSVW